MNKEKLISKEDNPDNRNHQVPFIGYEFQCPKCKAYVAYFTSNDSYMNISELQHNTVVEEGKKNLEQPNCKQNVNDYKNLLTNQNDCDII